MSVPLPFIAQEKPDRVIITNSTLQAYQAMRGNNDKIPIEHGPLYKNLQLLPYDDLRQNHGASLDLPAFGRDADE